MQTFLFPGQGSQFCGMGGALFDEFPEITRLADATLGYSIKTACLEDPHQQLNLTQYTQPALFTVNALHYFKLLKTHDKPDYLAGHSLGEYNALLAAQVFDFETGLKLVKKRGELMGHIQNGSMAAVIGITAENLQDILNQQNQSHLTIANYNSYLQNIISGTSDAIRNTTELLQKKTSATVIPLKVSGAFHSDLMQHAALEFEKYISQFHFHTPCIPVLANIDAAYYHPSMVSAHLAAQISHSVQWTKIIDILRQKENMQFLEVGPGNVLSGLLKRIEKGI